MNASQSIQVNQEMINTLVESSKEMAIRLNISVSEAIDKKIKVFQKVSKNDTEKTAWFLRGEEAKKMI